MIIKLINKINNLTGSVYDYLFEKYYYNKESIIIKEEG
jgi:hypothetical protein